MKHTPTMTTVDYFLTFEPGTGFSGKLDEEAAQRRHSSHEPYVLALPDRIVSFGPRHEAVIVYSMGQTGPRGTLRYERHQDTGRYRLTHLDVYNHHGEPLAIDVSLWGGTGRLHEPGSQDVKEHQPPDEWLREVMVSGFGYWDGLVTMSMDPSQWTKLPAGFQVRS